MRTSNSSFEATFADLSFTQTEILKHAKLRLNFLKNCLPQFTLRVFDGHTRQLLDEQVYVAKQHGVTVLPLTRPMKKFISGQPNLNKSLKIKVVFDSSTMNQASCVGIVNKVSQEAYLVTHTKEKPQRRSRRDSEHFRRNTEISRRNIKVPRSDYDFFRNFNESTRKNSGTEDISRTYNDLNRADTEDSPKSAYHGIAKRNAASSKKCIAQSVYVNLTYANSSIALPQGFTTNVCGTWQPVPIGADPTVKEVAKAIHMATKKLPKINNPSCCKPTAYKKLHILYVDSKTHIVLRYLDHIDVAKCGCT